MNQKITSYGLILSGFVNISSVLLFSLFFTNPYLSNIQPNVTSNFGLFMIMVWGLTYIVVSSKISYVPNILLAFALEKITYSIVWLFWWKENFSKLNFFFEQDKFSFAFQALYGLNDFGWFLFFIWAYFKLRNVRVF